MLIIEYVPWLLHFNYIRIYLVFLHLHSPVAVIPKLSTDDNRRQTGEEFSSDAPSCRTRVDTSNGCTRIIRRQEKQL